MATPSQVARNLKLDFLLSSPAPSGAPGEIDIPLPNISAFDHLYEEGDKWRLQWLVEWVEHHTVCEYVMRHHGSKGLRRVLSGIAKACSEHQVHMGKRVRSVAGSMGLETF